MNKNARAAAGAAAFIALLGASNSPKAAGNDARFADGFAQAGMAEIALAKIALTRSKDPHVIAFAEKMVHDHGLAGTKLASLASGDQISLPQTLTPMDAATKTQLQNVPASEFDAAYKTANVKGHAEALKLVAMEISAGGDSKLVAYAKKQRPIVQMHAQMAAQLPTT